MKEIKPKIVDEENVGYSKAKRRQIIPMRPGYGTPELHGWISFCGVADGSGYSFSQTVPHRISEPHVASGLGA